MENGKLWVNKTKRGKIVGQVQFDNGKKMPVPPHYQLEESLNGKDCRVKRENGLIVQVMVDGKGLQRTCSHGSDYYKNKESKKTSRPKKTDNRQKEGRLTTVSKGKLATAPYNFIPLDECVVGADFEPDSVFNDTYHKDRFSGRIELELENITPLYIRDTGNLKEDSAHNEVNSNFFSPGGRVKIPGSSLRGMIRMMVEIVSWGKFTFFDDKLLYYRGLADKSSLRREYQTNMSSYDRKTKSTQYKFNAGYLKKEGLEYYIIPAQKDGAGKQFTQIHQRHLPKGYANRQFFCEKRDDGKYLVMSGKMSNKKRHWLINAPDNEAPKILVPENDIDAYRNDASRFTDKGQQDDRHKRDGDLLRQIKVSSEGMVPCFYVCWKDSRGKDRVSFGHTGYFRLAYKKSVGDHVPLVLRESEKLDMPEAIFGKETQFASRVFFEDAEILPGQNDAVMEELSPKILSGPKPTTFQHYLEQQTDNIKNLRHWNDAANIRGYKLYWHKQINNNPDAWKEDAITSDTQHTIIRPVKPNTRFKGNIRFENLSEIELGALLFALSLPENHYHKLGMGKPLGLGSVKITPKLIVSDREQRYTKLFSNGSWELGKQEHRINKFKNEFEKYMLERIEGEGQKKSLWDTERLRQLKAMLDWNNTQIPGWLKKTGYMELNSFKDRPILPKPLQITNE